MHELEVVDHHKVETAILALQLAALGAKLDRGEHEVVVEPDGSSTDPVGLGGQSVPVVPRELALREAAPVQLSFRSQHSQGQLVRGHLQREEGHLAPCAGRGVSSDVECEGRLANRGTGRQNGQGSGLQAEGVLVQGVDAGGHAGDGRKALLHSLLNCLQVLQGTESRLRDPLQGLDTGALRGPEHLLLSGVQKPLDVGAGLVSQLDDPLGGEHHPTRLRLLVHQPSVVGHVGGRTDGPGQRKRQLQRYRGAQQPLRIQPLLHQDGVEILGLLGQLLARSVHMLVGEQIEVTRPQERCHLVERGLLGQDCSQYRLLCLQAMGQVTCCSQSGDRSFQGPACRIFSHRGADCSSRGRRGSLSKCSG